jgi:O-antigen/teichoic acid export membrane protein
MLVVSFSGVFFQVMLPSITKLYSKGRIEELKVLVFNSTKYISIFISFIVFLLVINAPEILNAYMGKSYVSLTPWLVVWLITLLGLHNSAIGSLMISIGKMRPLILMSCFSCLLSLSFTGFFASRLGVGSAVFGYFLYVVFQLAFYYAFLVPKYIQMSSVNLLSKAVAPAMLAGTASLTMTYAMVNLLDVPGLLVSIVFKTLFFAVIFFLLLLWYLLSAEEKAIGKRKLRTVFHFFP